MFQQKTALSVISALALAGSAASAQEILIGNVDRSTGDNGEGVTIGPYAGGFDRHAGVSITVGSEDVTVTGWATVLAAVDPWGSGDSVFEVQVTVHEANGFEPGAQIGAFEVFEVAGEFISYEPDIYTTDAVGGEIVLSAGETYIIQQYTPTRPGGLQYLYWLGMNQSVGGDADIAFNHDVFSATGDDGTWYDVDDNLGWDLWGFAGSSCTADFNADGVVDTRDVLDFLNAWTNSDDAADVNGDDLIDTRDVLDFLNLFTQGC